jgi:hypothetical protein
MIRLNNWRYFGFLIAYLVINYVLHIFSVSDAMFIHGADSGRYIDSALSLTNNNEFGNLLFTGPVYPFFLSVHYKILGFNYGNEFLIVTQAFLLYVTGMIAGNLAVKILPYKHFIGQVVMLLVIFNPNSLMATHLVQTESLFTLLLISYLYLLIILIKKGDGVILLALMALLISLTRPAGMYIMLMFILPSIILRMYGTSWRKLLSINIIYYFILLSGLGLWALNNHNKSGEFFVSANEGVVFYDQYIALLQYGKNMSMEDSKARADMVYKDMIEKEKIVCKDGISSFKCRKVIAKSYINAISNEDVGAIIKATMSSFVNLMFSGGASNFANYYGVSNKASVLSFERSEGSMLSWNKLSMFLSSINIKYFAILLIFWGYSLTIKILCVIGLTYLFKDLKSNYLALLLFLYVFLFSAEYLFLGQSRWRVPLDPIIVIFSALGLYSVLSYFKINKLRFNYKKYV